MTVYDFIEIGTSDFNTEIEKATDDTFGISIEPIKKYLDNLPNKKRCTKVNCAVSDHNGVIEIYYVPNKNIKKYNLPEFIRGCNSVNDYHPTVLKLLKEKNIKPENVFLSDRVPVIDFETLSTAYKVDGCKFLKIDTEGHDCIILQSYLQYCKKINKLLADKIMFEKNVLSDKEEVGHMINKLKSYGYVVIKKNPNDITLALPQFTGKINDTYLKGYPEGFNPTAIPYKNTLEDAMNWCMAHSDCGGITLQNGIYEARKGNVAIYQEGFKNLASWIKK